MRLSWGIAVVFGFAVVSKINFGALAFFVVIDITNKIRPAYSASQSGFHASQQTSLVVAVGYQRVVGLCYVYWPVPRIANAFGINST